MFDIYNPNHHRQWMVALQQRFGQFGVCLMYFFVGLGIVNISLIVVTLQDKFITMNNLAFFNIFIHYSLLIHSFILFLNFYLRVFYDIMVSVDRSYDSWLFSFLLRSSGGQHRKESKIFQLSIMHGKAKGIHFYLDR